MSQDYLRIDSNVVWQLGEQLITDAEQALLELVKNAYDADAQQVRLSIEPDYEPEPSLGLAPYKRGRLRIIDDGFGMSLQDIQQGWFVISLSRKRQQKRAGVLTKRGRTPQGDKGLGRLSTMKIGDVIILETHHDPNAVGQKVWWSWNDFIPGITLDTVVIKREEIPPTGHTGTVVTIVGLKDAAAYASEGRRKQLQTKLSTLVSPFEQFADFRIALEVDNVSIPFEQFESALRETAASNFSFEWDDNRLICKGRVQLSLFRSKATRDAHQFYDEWVSGNDGQRLAEFLLNRKELAQYNLALCRDRPWFLTFSQEIAWEEIDKELLPYEAPGPFSGEVDSFDLDEDPSTRPTTLSRQDDYRSYVKNQAGVFVYRDGFGVRQAKDWLGLATAFSAGRSYYSLRPSNTIGFVAITAAHNAKLEEKSDREGFTDSPASRAFYLLVSRFVKFANDSLNYLRRGYLSFRDETQRQQAGLPDAWTSETAQARLQELAAKAEQERRRTQASSRPVRLGAVRERLEDAKKKSSDNAPLLRDLDVALDEVRRLKEESTEDHQAVESLETTVKQAAATAEALQEKFNRIQRQLADVYGNVGVGIAAQTLAHDTDLLIDELLARTKKVMALLSKLEQPIASALSGYMEAVKAIANNIRRHLRFINPMLYGVRETKQQIDVVELINEYGSLRVDSFARYRIEMKVEVKKAFFVSMNKGRLLQVLDNLVRNSEYWLRQHALMKSDALLEIHICVDSPKIVVWDTGPGVRPAIEETLFDAFVTDKTDGHGLGLFIARQLLDREQCSIILDTARNALGKRFRFVINLAGVLNGNS